MRKVDLTNRLFGRLKVISYAGQLSSSNANSHWNCKCQCGETVTVSYCNLVSGKTQSCGCLREELIFDNPRYDLRGKRFGKLLVIDCLKRNANETSSKPTKYWKCLCDCGRTHEADYSHLIGGDSIQCKYCKLIQMKRTQAEDLTGNRYGKLVCEEMIVELGTNIRWRCKCDCGKTKIAQAYLLKRGACQSCGCEARPKREQHYKWNPNITDEERQNRRQESKQGNDFKKAVKNRDGHKCVLSGKRDYLVVHHIESWNSNTDKRFDPNNGITLNRKIHKLFHAVYGNGNNTREQFDDFKEGWKVGYYTWNQAKHYK